MHTFVVDFSIIRENKAALTVFDTPVKTDEPVLLYRLLFEKVAQVAISAARLL